MRSMSFLRAPGPDRFSQRRSQTLNRHYDLDPFRSKWNRSAGGHLDLKGSIGEKAASWSGRFGDAGNCCLDQGGRVRPWIGADRYQIVRNAVESAHQQINL